MQSDPKTLFITSFHPLISRNILQTKVLALIAQNKNLYINILCPRHKEQYFQRYFSKENVHIVAVDIRPLSRFEKIWKEIGNALLRTSTIYDNRKERYELDRNIIGYAVFLCMYHFVARIPLITRLYQLLSLYVIRSHSYTHIFKQYSSATVFSTDIFHDEDVRVLREARRRKFENIGMVRSWDNCTNKGILPVVPERILVHTDIIKGELKKYHTGTDSKITTVGIPQFDYYKGYIPKNPDTFFTRTGFDRSSKVILFAPTGSKFVDDDYYILQVLVDAIHSGVILGKPNVLVRFPPGDHMNLEKVTIDPSIRIYIDRPGISFNEKILKDREMSDADMEWLADSLYISDVLISVGSTLCIDIAVFDKPIICPSIGGIFDVRESRSMKKMYKKFHYQYLLRTKGCAYPQSVTEFIGEVNKALYNPEERRDGRKQLVKEQVGVFDGQSCRRLAEEVVSYI